MEKNETQSNFLHNTSSGQMVGIRAKQFSCSRNKVKLSDILMNMPWLLDQGCQRKRNSIEGDFSSPRKRRPWNNVNTVLNRDELHSEPIVAEGQREDLGRF